MTQIFRNNAVTKDFLQHFHCWLYSMNYYSILLEPGVSILQLPEEK